MRPTSPRVTPRATRTATPAKVASRKRGEWAGRRPAGARPDALRARGPGPRRRHRDAEEEREVERVEQQPEGVAPRGRVHLPVDRERGQHGPQPGGGRGGREGRRPSRPATPAASAERSAAATEGARVPPAAARAATPPMARKTAAPYDVKSATPPSAPARTALHAPLRRWPAARRSVVAAGHGQGQGLVELGGLEGGPGQQGPEHGQAPGGGLCRRRGPARGGRCGQAVRAPEQAEEEGSEEGRGPGRTRGRRPETRGRARRPRRRSPSVSPGEASHRASAAR